MKLSLHSYDLQLSLSMFPRKEIQLFDVSLFTEGFNYNTGTSSAFFSCSFLPSLLLFYSFFCVYIKASHFIDLSLLHPTTLNPVDLHAYRRKKLIWKVGRLFDKGPAESFITTAWQNKPLFTLFYFFLFQSFVSYQNIHVVCCPMGLLHQSYNQHKTRGNLEVFMGLFSTLLSCCALTSPETVVYFKASVKTHPALFPDDEPSHCMHHTWLQHCSRRPTAAAPS